MKINLLGQSLDLDSGFESLERQLKQAFPLDHTSKIWASTVSYCWGGSGARYNQIELSGDTDKQGSKISLHFFDQSPDSKIYCLRIDNKNGMFTIIEQNPNYEICEKSLERFENIIEVVKQ